MNDLTRGSHDAELERLQEKMSAMDPTTDEYGKLLKHYDILIQAANDDDKIKADAEAEMAKVDAEEQRTRQAAEDQKKSNLVSLINAGVGAVTTIGVYVLICIANKKIHERALQFEMDGYAYTTRSDKYLMKMPNHKI